MNDRQREIFRIESAKKDAARRLAERQAGMTADDIMTQLVQAPSAEAATAVIAGVGSRALLLELADLLYLDNPEGHGSAWLRKAIVREARS